MKSMILAVFAAGAIALWSNAVPAAPLSGNVSAPPYSSIVLK